jgi:hypothetical protein
MLLRDEAMQIIAELFTGPPKALRDGEISSLYRLSAPTM